MARPKPTLGKALSRHTTGGTGAALFRQNLGEILAVAALWTHGDGLACLHQIRRNVGLAPVNDHMAVRNDLPSGSARFRESHAVNHIVEAALQQNEKISAGFA